MFKRILVQQTMLMICFHGFGFGKIKEATILWIITVHSLCYFLLVADNVPFFSCASLDAHLLWDKLIHALAFHEVKSYTLFSMLYSFAAFYIWPTVPFYPSLLWFVKRSVNVRSLAISEVYDRRNREGSSLIGGLRT